MESIVYIRNKIIHFLYTNILKLIFFLIDPEFVHDIITKTGSLMGANPIIRGLTSLLFNYSHKALKQDILGIKFKNPVGLAAGFDKDARLTQILPSVGFGFTEVGTITGEKCSGNPKPRLWRLKKSKGLIVYYGLKNDGSEVIAKRLRKEKFAIPVITSIGKTNNQETSETDAGIKDYVKAYKEFTNIGNIFDINISCPNAFGGQPFSDPKKLDELLSKIDAIPTKKPVFLKMPPDLSDKELDGILTVAKKHKVAGFICTNLTKDRSKMKSKIYDAVIPEKGGISGRVVEDLANNLISRVYNATRYKKRRDIIASDYQKTQPRLNRGQGKYVIIGCGGVFSAEDAYKKIKLGASLIQLITGMVFEGPQVISEINQGLVKLLQKDGYKNISEAIGTESV